MEAFISSMIAAGDARKRPPHMVLVISLGSESLRKSDDE
jgi:hypothetical protein